MTLEKSSSGGSFAMSPLNASMSWYKESSFLQEGQDVKVKLLAIKDGKLDLSIKKALPAPERPAQRNFQPRPAAVPRPAAAPRRPTVQAADTTPSGDLAFEDKLKQFLSSSERKMADLNRNISGKQGGRRRR